MKNSKGSVHILHSHREGRGQGVSKMLMHDYGRGGGGWHYNDISKNIFFTKWNSFEIKNTMLT